MKRMLYTVRQTIQSTRIDGNEPVDVQFYSGDDRASAITAMAQASEVTDPEWVVLHAVHLKVEEHPCQCEPHIGQVRHMYTCPEYDPAHH